MFKLLLTVPKLAALILLFRKHVWQLFFLVALAFLYAPISTGVGTFAAETWFAASNTFLTESMVTLAIAVFTLPPLLFLLRRLCNNPFMKQAVTFWRFIWLLPVFFFAITMITSSYLNEKEKGIEFIVIRVVVYFAILLICYLLEKAVRQVIEAQTARETAEAARKERRLAELRAENAERDLELQRHLAETIPPESLIVRGPLTLNTAKRQAFLRAADLELRDKEFNLLAYFIEHENEVVSQSEVYQAVWKQPYVSTDHAFRGALQRLRDRIEGCGYEINYLRGKIKGYRFEKE